MRKRDGRTVPFDAERLFASIRAALAAAGNDQPRLADDLGSVVITYIESHGTAECIGTAEIADFTDECWTASGAGRTPGRAGPSGKRRSRRTAAAPSPGARWVPPVARS